MTETNSVRVSVTAMAMTGDEREQTSTEGNKATVTRRCFNWLKDVNLRVRVMTISLLSNVDCQLDTIYAVDV